MDVFFKSDCSRKNLIVSLLLERLNSVPIIYVYRKEGGGNQQQLSVCVQKEKGMLLLHNDMKGGIRYRE